MDRFDEVIGKYLVPMADFRGPVMDSTYFFRKDGSFVFAEGYCHPPGALWGMIIKYPHPEGHIDIFGRPHSWTHREIINGELVIVPSEQQVENQFKVAPELREVQGEKPPYARTFVKFPLSDFGGFFDGRRSMELLRGEYEWIDRAVRETCELLGVDPDGTGVTGSLAYGRAEDDIDIVFIDSPEQNARTAENIRQYVREHPESKVVELGKEWPLRFHFAGTLICPFFQYADPSRIPFREGTMEVLEEGVSLEAFVTDDLHNLYLPAIVGLSDVKRAGGRAEEDMELVIYNGAMRGELWRGDRLSFQADLVLLTTPEEGSRRAALVTELEAMIRKTA